MNDNIPKENDLNRQLNTLTISPTNTIRDNNISRLCIGSQVEEISDDSFNDDDFKLLHEEFKQFEEMQALSISDQLAEVKSMTEKIYSTVNQ